MSCRPLASGAWPNSAQRRKGRHNRNRRYKIESFVKRCNQPNRNAGVMFTRSKGFEIDSLPLKAQSLNTKRDEQENAFSLVCTHSWDDRISDRNGDFLVALACSVHA